MNIHEFDSDNVVSNRLNRSNVQCGVPKATWSQQHWKQLFTSHLRMEGYVIPLIWTLEWIAQSGRIAICFAIESFAKSKLKRWVKLHIYFQELSTLYSTLSISIHVKLQSLPVQFVCVSVYGCGQTSHVFTRSRHRSTGLLRATVNVAAVACWVRFDSHTHRQ